MREAVGSGALRILVVDDESTYREYLDCFLSRRGMQVRTAGTGAEAISIGLEFRPDVLLVDWRLRSELQGVDVAEALRAEQPDLRILLMTGCSAADLEVETIRAGIDGYLEKPFSLDDVSRAIEQAAAPLSPD